MGLCLVRRLGTAEWVNRLLLPAGRRLSSVSTHGPKLSHRHLEVVTPPVLRGGRVMASAGELAQIVNGESFEFLAYIEFREPGVVRANHFHGRKAETLYVIRGELEARFKDLDTDESTELRLTSGDLVVVQPRCAHAYQAVSAADTLEFSATPYDPDDTFAHLLIGSEGVS
jgi:quercetin dioxygenase-like cupin family protein